MRECGALSHAGASLYTGAHRNLSGMKVRIEPKPLHEPLAGGTPGATVTVEPIVAGTRHLAAHDDGDARVAASRP